MRAIIAVLLLPGLAWGTLLTIEADDFEAETNISEHFEDVTLRAWHWFEGEYSDLYAVDSTNYLPLLGDNVLGYYDPWYPLGKQEFWSRDPYLRIDLNNAYARSLEIFVFAKYGQMTGNAILKGYNEQGELINHIPQWGVSESQVSRLWSYQLEDYSVAYYELYAEYVVCFDHITIDYEVIPEPGTIVLLLGGLLLLRLRRR